MIFLGKTARSAPFANVPTATRITSYTELVQVVREHILEKYGTRWPEQIKMRSEIRQPIGWRISLRIKQQAIGGY